MAWRAWRERGAALGRGLGAPDTCAILMTYMSSRIQPGRGLYVPSEKSAEPGVPSLGELLVILHEGET